MFEIDKVEGNIVFFKNFEDEGKSGWLKIVYTGTQDDYFKFSLNGKLNNGTILPGKNILVTAGDIGVQQSSKEPINPTKVFKWVAKMLTKYLNDHPNPAK